MTTQRSVDFMCAYCDSKATLIGDFPLTDDELAWRDWAKLGNRFSCTICGSFLFPVVLFPGHEKMSRMFYNFSRCPSADDCYNLGFYEPDCERSIISTRCIASLHYRMGNIEYLIKSGHKDEGE